MKIVRNNIEIGKWYHGLTMIPQAYCNDKLVFPNIYSDVEEGYDVMCSGTIDDYEGTAPEVYVMSVSKWYMRTTGGNYKEYGVYGDNKNDPYVGELVVVDGHEWEYTSSGWVDLGEGEEGKIQEYFISQKSSDPFEFKLEHYWNTGYRMVVDFFLNGTYSSDVGGIIRAYDGESLFELNLYNNGYYLDWHTPTSTSSPTTYSGDYTDRELQTSLSTQMPKDKTRLLMELKARTKATIFNYDTGVQLGTYGTIYDSYTYCTTGKYKVGIRRNSANNTTYIHGIKVYDNNNNLVNDFEVKYRGGSGSNQFYVQDNVDKTIYEDLSGSTNIVYEVIETGETVLPKYYTDLDAPDPIDYGYYTSPDEYLKVSDNYYNKDYVTEIYSGGCEVITTEYVQGDQLTPTYVQGEASDFIVYDGGRYYKNYIYVTPVSTPIATGDYVMGEYIGPADVLVSGLTNSSTAFDVKINGTNTPVTIGSSSGSYYEWRVYGDLSQTYNLYDFSNSNKVITAHFNPDLKVSNFDCAFESQGNLTECTLPSGITNLGGYTFFQCTKLTSITLPDGLTTIGSQCFDYSGLINVYIPASVTSIAIEAFRSAGKIESIVVDPNNTVYDSRENCNAIIETSTNRMLKACKNSFIPDSVASLTYSFYEVNINEVTVPSAVTNMYDAFRGSTAVVHMLSTTPPTVSYGCFNGGYGIIYVPVGTAETYKAASNWSNYASRIFEEGTDFSTKPVTGTASGGTVQMYFGSSTGYNGIYYDAGKFFIDAPATATTVGYYSNYKASTNITSIDLSRMANLTTIHESAFNGYGNPNMLTSVILPDTVTTIMNVAFSYQNNLTSINMPSSLVTIGDYAFDDCNVPSITIPSTVTSIGRYAFNTAYNTVFHFESETPCTLSSGVFTYNSGGFIFVPVGTAATYKAASNWSNYASKIYEEGETPWVNAKITGKGGGYYMSRHSSGTMYVYHYVYDANGNSYANPPYNITSIGVGSTGEGVRGMLAHVDFRSCTTATATGNYFVYSNANVKGIRLPSSISVYYSLFVMGDNVALDYITLDAVTPPEYLNFGSTTARIANFYVPDESVNAYKAATGWKELAGIIKPMSDFATDFPNE